MHIDRNRPSCHGLGKYSELIATAAFISEGVQVAVPYGCQQGWDLLIEAEGHQWLRVQVKTARRVKGQVIVDLQTGRGVYTKDDADIIVAVLPETGDIWKFNLCDVSGKKMVGVMSRPLWIKGSAHTESSKGGRATGSKGFLTQEMRDQVLKVIGNRPEGVSELNYEITLQWARGKKCRLISDERGISMESIRDRLTRTIKRLI